MTRINLLPWREALRTDRQRRFLITVAMTALFALAVVGGVHYYLDSLLTHQNQRNAFLEKEIAVLNSKLSKIRKLEAERKALLDRMTIIQRLQATRPEIVHLFDEIPRRLPDGVYLKSMKQSGKTITLKGVAQSNARVSSFMRNLDQSEWFANPVLKVIKTVAGSDGSKQRLAEFTLTISQVNPQLPKDGEAGAGKG
jgi:type IV pilus assembly protein PilN